MPILHIYFINKLNEVPDKHTFSANMYNVLFSHLIVEIPASSEGKVKNNYVYISFNIT
jgi:hypothetical protein